jgi:hypothetical protein
MKGHGMGWEGGSFVSNDPRLLPHALNQPDLTVSMDSTKCDYKPIGISEGATADVDSIYSAVVRVYLTIISPDIGAAEFGDWVRCDCEGAS